MRQILLMACALCVLISSAVGFALRPTHTLGLRLRSAKLLMSETEVADVANIGEEDDDDEDKVLDITPKAMSHISMLHEKQTDNKCLRMGVRSGGCSGMSYVMDFVADDSITEDDHVEIYENVKCVIDPKSLLFLYGLKLDYSDELIGGGFQFSNPNAETSCGCGKSFGV